jgi:DNA mismatch repair protein MutS2
LEANPPRFIDPNAKEIVTLRELRHPLLVWQQQHEQGTAVVPINVQIQPHIRVVAITGPNTGGKTVTLKTLGLAALMAKVGLFVPAKVPVELPWFEQVLADIGDEQSLEQSLSTFSGHIRRISRILEALGQEESQLPIPNSLVLLDEVGAGTDPAEGSALAIALLKYLAEHAQLTIATTHYGELKALKYQDERFENASVEFDDVTLSPTYRLLWGIPGRSNALTIARRLGLNPDVVDEAQTRVGGASEDLNQVIAGLEAQRRRQETKAKEATQLLQQAERLHEEVSRKAAHLQERERDLKLSQEREVQQALVQAKAEIAQVIRKLQQGPLLAQNAQRATEALNEIAQRQISVAKAKPGFKPKIGDRVRIPRLNQTAEVLSAADDNGELTVRFGIMKMTVPLADIESLDGQKPEIPVKAKPAPAAVVVPAAPPVRTSKNTVDIRGKRISEAEYELEQALSQAVTSGALWIIHGKGTGRLRQGVHEFLERHPLVDRFELTTQNEGGAGVTVAYLR